MNEFMIGYARVSTNEQDLTAQRNALLALGVRSNLIYTVHGLTGTNRAPPGLREALAACRNGDTHVVAKLDRLARSLRAAKDIIDELTVKGVTLSIGGSVHDPTDPVGRLLFNVLAMVAEFESDLIRARTREGMQVAKANGHLRDKQSKLSQPDHPFSGESPVDVHAHVADYLARVDDAAFRARVLGIVVVSPEVDSNSGGVSATPRG